MNGLALAVVIVATTIVLVAGLLVGLGRMERWVLSVHDPRGTEVDS